MYGELKASYQIQGLGDLLLTNTFLVVNRCCDIYSSLSIQKIQNLFSKQLSNPEVLTTVGHLTINFEG